MFLIQVRLVHRILASGYNRVSRVNRVRLRVSVRVRPKR